MLDVAAAVFAFAQSRPLCDNHLEAKPDSAV